MLRRSALAVALLAVAGCASDTNPTVTLAPPGQGLAAKGGAEHEHEHTGPRSDREERLSRGVRAELAQVRRLTARYHDLDKARADGYTVWSPDPFAAGATCPSNPEGKMGYHLVKVSLRGGAAHPELGDANIDPMQPEMLLYEKRPDGKMHLVGVEYIVFKAAWERVHGAGAAAPTVFGQPLLASSHTFPGNALPLQHYELHVWIWTKNPLGMFYPWNPTVTC